jgi:hypothetical protein
MTYVLEPDGATLAEQEALHRARGLILGAIRTDGFPALARVLVRAQQGDPVAAGMPVGALLRALPTANTLGAHDLLRVCGLHESHRLCDLDAHQRSVLIARISHLPGAPGWER